MSHQLAIKIIPKKQLSATDSAMIVSLCSHAFEEDYSPYFNSFDDSIHILGYLDGEIVSHVLWVTRWLQIGNSPLLRAAYVEGVATGRSYRGQGFATLLMERLAKEIVDYEIGGLSPAETSLYTRLGWEYWQGPLLHRKSGKLIPDSPDETLMILRLPQTPDLDLSLPISVEWREGEVW